jgi:hypothetical protein
MWEYSSSWHKLWKINAKTKLLLLFFMRIQGDPSLSGITLGSAFDPRANWSLPPVCFYAFNLRRSYPSWSFLFNLASDSWATVTLVRTNTLIIVNLVGLLITCIIYRPCYGVRRVRWQLSYLANTWHTLSSYLWQKLPIVPANQCFFEVPRRISGACSLVSFDGGPFDVFEPWPLHCLPTVILSTQLAEVTPGSPHDSTRSTELKTLS